MTAFIIAKPSHLLIRLEILTFIKTTPDSLTIAFASMVIPVPSGPYNKYPLLWTKKTNINNDNSTIAPTRGQHSSTKVPICHKGTWSPVSTNPK